MRRRGTRAQASFEYIMIYGWATLIILGSLGALYSFDLLNFNGFVGDKCTFYGQVECFESQALSDPNLDTGNITLVLQNDFGTDLVVYNISVTDKFFTCDALPDSGSLDLDWPENENARFTLNCGAMDEDFVAGSRTKSTVDVFYYRNISICKSGGAITSSCLLHASGTLEQTIQQS